MILTCLFSFTVYLVIPSKFFPCVNFHLYFIFLLRLLSKERLSKIPSLLNLLIKAVKNINPICYLQDKSHWYLMTYQIRFFVVIESCISSQQISKFNFMLVLFLSLCYYWWKMKRRKIGKSIYNSCLFRFLDHLNVDIDRLKCVFIFFKQIIYPVAIIKTDRKLRICFDV